MKRAVSALVPPSIDASQPKMQRPTVPTLSVQMAEIVEQRGENCQLLAYADRDSRPVMWSVPAVAAKMGMLLPFKSKENERPGAALLRAYALGIDDE